MTIATAVKDSTETLLQLRSSLQKIEENSVVQGRLNDTEFARLQSLQDVLAQNEASAARSPAHAEGCCSTLYRLQMELGEVYGRTQSLYSAPSGGLVARIWELFRLWWIRDNVEQELQSVQAIVTSCISEHTAPLRLEHRHILEPIENSFHLNNFQDAFNRMIISMIDIGVTIPKVLILIHLEQVCRYTSLQFSRAQEPFRQNLGMKPMKLQFSLLGSSRLVFRCLVEILKWGDEVSELFRKLRPFRARIEVLDNASLPHHAI